MHVHWVESTLGFARDLISLTFLGDRTPMRQDTSQLTPRQTDVLASLIAGRSNREIAAELNMGLGTVKAHLSAIYEKLGVSNRTQAALVGVRILPMLRALSG
jgi:DNA-binding NarL/FixJ family response regulator